MARCCPGASPPASARCPARTRRSRPRSWSASCPTCRTCRTAGPRPGRRPGRARRRAAGRPARRPAAAGLAAGRPGRGTSGRPRLPRPGPRRARGAWPTATPGPLKVQVAGPWTLAASLELPRGERALTDPGALPRPVGSLADGAARHVTSSGRGAGRRAGGAARRAVAARRAGRRAAPPSGYGGVARCAEHGGRAGCSAPLVDGRRRTGRRALLRRAAARRAAPPGRAAGAVASTCCSSPTRLGGARRGGRGRPGLCAGVVPAPAARAVDGPTLRATVEPYAGRGAVSACRRAAGRQVVVTPTCGLAGACPGARAGRAAARAHRRTSSAAGRTEGRAGGRGEAAREADRGRRRSTGTPSSSSRSTGRASPTTCATHRRSATACTTR